MATNFLKFCTSDANGLASALAAGASGIDCVADVGKIYTGLVEGAAGSGLLVAWAVALGSNFVGSSLRIIFWGFFHCFLPTTLLNQQGKDFFFSSPWPIDNA